MKKILSLLLVEGALAFAALSYHFILFDEGIVGTMHGIIQVILLMGRPLSGMLRQLLLRFSILGITVQKPAAEESNGEG